MKKIAILSTALCSLSLLAACGNNDSAGTATAAESSTRVSVEISDAPTAPVTYVTETLAESLNTAYSLAFLPSGDMLVTEKSGALRVIRDDQLLPTPVSGTPEVHFKSQAGMFEVVLHPDFENNSLIYLSYAHGTEAENGVRLARARFVPSDEGGSLEDLEVLFTASPLKAGSAHYGGKIIFLEDGTLMMTTGEGYRYREQAPTLDNHFGKIIRLNDDGSVPTDNPFVGQEGALPEIWSYGHRNPQGLIVDPATGTVYSHEHGPKGGDEVNIIEKGKNYGWPIITYGVDYSGAVISPFTERDGLEQPVVHYVPSIAPSGFTMYDGDQFPAWQGDLFIGALAFKEVRRIDLDENGNFGAQEKLFTELDERIRDVRTGPDGFMYLMTDASRSSDSNAKVIRVRPQ
jgi:glucose/arabinose dehydrogenase